MTPEQITQLRQHLKELRKMIVEEYVLVCPLKFGICKHDNEHCPIFRIDRALALLPCPTCNGTGIMPESKSYPDGLTIGREGKSCPDCQQYCVCCEEITEENAHLHRNCGK